jgi:DNA repair photolyase
MIMMDNALFPAQVPSGAFGGAVVLPEEAKSILRPQKDERLGFGFSLNPYRGCTHGCKYCFVREYPSPEYSPLDWGGWCRPKVNAPELLWKQRHRVFGQSIFMSAATDPYQPLERQFRLSRRCLEILLKCPGASVSIHTRSPLLLDDLSMLKEFGERLSVGISIPTDDDSVRRAIEPLAPSIASRWAMARRLSDAGINVFISATPIFPMQSVEKYIQMCIDSGVQSAWAGRLRLISRDPFRYVLQKHDWMHILEKGFGAEIKEGLAAAFSGDELGEPSECGEYGATSVEDTSYHLQATAHDAPTPRARKRHLPNESQPPLF